MATMSDSEIKQAAADLKDTPYELTFISAPTPGTTRYQFQHTVALTGNEARAVIAEALETLRAGKAEWTSGTRYGDNPGDVVPEQWAAIYGPSST